MIASYGIKFVLIAFVLTVIAAFWATGKDSLLLFIVSLVLALLTLMLTYFYRNPARQIVAEPNQVLANADGTILSVEEVENEYVGGKCHKVSIFLSVFNVHINRIPIDGKIEYVKMVDGEFYAAYKEESTKNQQSDVGIATNYGKIIFKQLTGLLARRIECRLEEGNQVKAGEIYGMIHFGSRAELFIPLDAKVMVEKGDKVKGGLSVIAEF